MAWESLIELKKKVLNVHEWKFFRNTCDFQTFPCDFISHALTQRDNERLIIHSTIGSLTEGPTQQTKTQNAWNTNQIYFHTRPWPWLLKISIIGLRLSLQFSVALKYSFPIWLCAETRSYMHWMVLWPVLLVSPQFEDNLEAKNRILMLF